LSEFHRAGGSAKCLTLRLDDGPAVAAGAGSATPADEAVAATREPGPLVR